MNITQLTVLVSKILYLIYYYLGFCILSNISTWISTLTVLLSTCSSLFKPQPQLLTKSTQVHEQKKLDNPDTSKLYEWFNNNLLCPYPCPKTKKKLATECNLSSKQIDNWFKYNRRLFNQNVHAITKRENKKIIIDALKESPYPNHDEIQIINQKTNIPVEDLKKCFKYYRSVLKNI
jgi:hypothetical protein